MYSSRSCDVINSDKYHDESKPNGRNMLVIVDGRVPLSFVN